MRAHVGPILACAPHTGPKKMNICRQFKALSSPLLEQFCELRHCTTIDYWPVPNYDRPGLLQDVQSRMDALLQVYSIYITICICGAQISESVLGCSSTESPFFFSLEVKMIQHVGKALFLPALSSSHIYNYCLSRMLHRSRICVFNLGEKR
jgi:hypothetical protein